MLLGVEFVIREEGEVAVGGEEEEEMDFEGIELT